MTVSFESARAYVSQKAPWLVPVISATTAEGSTNFLVDTGLWTNPDNNYLTAESAIGMYIYFPDSSTASERIRRVSGSTGPVDTSNGRLYWDGVAWSGNVAAAAQYELSSLHPRSMFNVFVNTLRGFLIPDLAPVPGFTDADMEATGTTSYSVSGGGSISKVATAGNVYSGKQSLFFDAGTAGEYVEGPSVAVIPNQQYFGSVILRRDASGPFAFAIWDKTNDAEIESSKRTDHSLERFMSMQRTFKIPATCKEIAYRVYCTGASDDAYINSFHGPHKADDRVLDAPSFLNRTSMLRKVLYADYSLQYEEGVFDARSRDLTQFYPRDYALRINHAASNPYRLEFERSLPMAELWLEAIRKGTDIYTPAFTAAGETSPSVNIDEDLFGLSYIADLCRFVLTFKKDDTQANSTLEQIYKSTTEGGENLSARLAEYTKDLETPLQEPPYPVRSMAAL